MTTHSHRFLAFAALAIVGLSVNTVLGQSTSSLERIKHDVKYLASDELEGRGVETDGIHKAADYIIKEYKKAGIKPGGKDGSWKQKFPVRVGRAIDEKATSFVVHHGDEKVEMELGSDYQAMMTGGQGAIEGAEVAFAGYGIVSEDDNYNDFDGIDVKGKVCIIIGGKPSSLDNARLGRLTTKLKNAKDNGAVGVVFIMDRETTEDGKKDSLPAAGAFGYARPSARLPLVVVKRANVDEFLKGKPLKTATGDDLDSVLAIEKHISKKIEPVSQAVEGVKVSYKSKIANKSVDAFNVVGVIEGEGDKKDEVIVIGGHYDHLGFGPYGSRARGRIEVHNGADDNATGTAAVIELARRYGQYDKKPKRTLVFVCFSGEERGLVGSNYYVNKEPLFPLEKTVAMINYDMIGWLRKGKLTIYGTGTAAAFDGALESANKGLDLDLNKVPSPFAGSDHMPFNTKKIPCMFLHTGLTDTYHTPEDDYETLNMEGAKKVIDYSEKLIWKLANLDEAPKYKSATPQRRRPSSGGGDARVRASEKKTTEKKTTDSAVSVNLKAGYLGVELGESDENGVVVAKVQENSAASKSGIRAGDLFAKVGGKEVGKNMDVVRILGKTKPGETIVVELKRGETKLRIPVKLGKRSADADK